MAKPVAAAVGEPGKGGRAAFLPPPIPSQGETGPG